MKKEELRVYLEESVREKEAEEKELMVKQKLLERERGILKEQMELLSKGLLRVQAAERMLHGSNKLHAPPSLALPAVVPIILSKGEIA